MGNLVYLFAAYTVIWVVLFAYVINLSFKNRALRKKLEALESRKKGKG